MADWAVKDDSPACADCRSSFAWPHYSPPILVCKHPTVLARTGGPRSCKTICRAPGAVCGPKATLFQPKRHTLPDEDKDVPLKTYTAPA